MSLCPFVTGIFFLVPVPLLESDDEVMIKPMNRDTHLIVKWNALIFFNIYRKAVGWNKMGLIASLVTVAV